MPVRPHTMMEDYEFEIELEDLTDFEAAGGVDIPDEPVVRDQDDEPLISEKHAPGEKPGEKDTDEQDSERQSLEPETAGRTDMVVPAFV